MENNNLWNQVRDKCLKLACDLLDRQSERGGSDLPEVANLVSIANAADRPEPKPALEVSGTSNNKLDKKKLAELIREILEDEAKNHTSLGY